MSSESGVHSDRESKVANSNFALLAPLIPYFTVVSLFVCFWQRLQDCQVGKVEVGNLDLAYFRMGCG